MSNNNNNNNNNNNQNIFDAARCVSGENKRFTSISASVAAMLYRRPNCDMYAFAFCDSVK